MKNYISFLLIFSFIFSLFPTITTLASSADLSYTESHLEKDNAFNPTINVTLGRGDPGANSYIAQSFKSNGEPITGCRLHFKLGDTATMVIQIRKSLSGGNESILYSGSFPLVSNPHNITGFWDFEFSRAVPVEKDKTYYLVAWCENYHSYCIMSTTLYVCNNLVNRSYHKRENTTEWTIMPQRSFGYEILTNPNADVKGYPYQQDANVLMLHDAEEYYCFNEVEKNTTIELTPLHYTQSSYGMKIQGGTPDSSGSVLSSTINLFETADLTTYSHFYADVYLSQTIKTPFSLNITLTDVNKKTATHSISLTNMEKGWHRIHFTTGDLTASYENLFKRIAQIQFQGISTAYPENLYFVVDNICAAKEEIATFTSGYFTNEQLKEPSFVTSNEDYIGKPDDSPETEIIYGDINRDNAINAKDALFILQASVNKVNPTGEEFLAGDVDADSALNAKDALWVLKYAVNKVNHFPVEDLPVEDDTITERDFSISTEGLAPNTIYKINKSVIANTNTNHYGLAHDVARLISSLQGLINREVDKNHIALVIVDDYTDTWLPYIQENDDLLNELTETKVIPSISIFLETFKNQIKDCGMILWDPDAPSTANVAETICGLDGYLPVKYLDDTNSLYQKLIEMGVPVKLSLVDKFTGKGVIPDTTILSSGSVKCDPYLWALDKYSARCTSSLLIYTPDGASSTVGNIIYEGDVHAKSLDYNRSYGYDYGISQKAFFFDLSPLDIEAPCDDKTQKVGTDRATLIEILKNRYYRAGGTFGEVVGFPPWWFKYGAHNGWGSVADTTLEATFTELISQYNGYMDADGSITNCSLYTQFTLEESYNSIANDKPVTEVFDPNTVYLYMYTGDYDSSAWAMEHLLNAYNDPARGSIPITWSINPGMSKRIPMVFDYLYKNQTENDYFSASDSGIGYIRPQGLFQSESDRTLPNGDQEFVRISKEYFQKFDMDSVGFIIGKLSDNVCRIYNQIAPVGSNTNDVSWTPSVYVDTPYLRIKNGIGDPAKTEAEMETTVKGMLDFAQDMKAYNVAGFRTIKFSASDLKRTQEAFLKYAAENDPDTTYKFVDYRTYFAMMKEAGSGKYTLD